LKGADFVCQPSHAAQRIALVRATEGINEHVHAIERIVTALKFRELSLRVHATADV
jgi:hypothetical protein